MFTLDFSSPVRNPTDGTFATLEELEKSACFKNCKMSVTDTGKFDPEFLDKPWFLDIDLGMQFIWFILLRRF